MQDFKHHLFAFKFYLTLVTSRVLLVSCAKVSFMALGLAEVVRDYPDDTLVSVDDVHKVVLFIIPYLLNTSLNYPSSGTAGS